ncbi:ankyrin repeat domain-containing protein 66-like [Ptychodera flava]
MMSELHEAASMGDSDLLEELIDSQKYDVNQKDAEWSNRTPLHWAAIKGHSECIRILIENGSKSGARTDTGYTSTHFAAEGGKLGALKVLHKLNAPMDRTDKYGDTPKRVADIYGHKECVKF